MKELPRRVYMSATAAVVALVVLIGGLFSWFSSSTAPTPGRAAVTAFFDRYVRADGRVVRTDQGGDTVSEGQAYAMLMAAAIGDPARFASVWDWSQTHLLEPDGLMAWRWRGGSVADPNPASDADLGAAAALVLAAHRFSDGAYLSAARRMAAAVAADEVVTGPSGATLVAGPWARHSPEYVDPSYLAPEEMAQLSAAFGGLWPAVETTAEHQLESLTTGGTLPPDWATASPSGALRPSASPGPGGAPVRFGFDAARAPIWMAASCDPALRAAAAGLLPALERGKGQVDLALDGRPDPGVGHPIGELAEAAAEWAAGRDSKASALERSAARQNDDHPSYYGAAWIALTDLATGHEL